MRFPSPYTAVRNVALALAARAGFHVERICPTHSDRVALVEHLRAYGVDTVLDVGANVGQYARELFASGYAGRVVSFEPLSGPHAALCTAAAANPRWRVADRMCLGDHQGEASVNISANSVASSVLPLTATMDAHSPDAAYRGSETVPMRTLDAVADDYLGSARRPLLKIDVQGYEEQVLRGAQKLLPRLAGLQVELSLVELYQGQMLFSDMLRWIESAGFTAHRFIPSFIEGATGRWLQADVLAFRV